MKRIFLALLAGLLFAPLGFSASKMICAKTGKEVSGKCCCGVKSGKFLCSFDDKTYAQCCCELKS